MIAMSLGDAIELLSTRTRSLPDLVGTDGFTRHAFASVVVATALITDLEAVGMLDRLQHMVSAARAAEQSAAEAVN